MKKLALIFLVCIYTLSAIGVGINQFYCCGKLKSSSITFIYGIKEKCGHSNGVKGCCETRFSSYQLSDNYEAAQGISSFVKHFISIHQFTRAFKAAEWGNKLPVVNTSHAPPLHHGVPVYIFHCVYRI